MVAAYLDEPALQAEAASAAVQIACPRDDDDAGLRGPNVAAALKKARAFIEDADTREKIDAHLATLGAQSE